MNEQQIHAVESAILNLDREGLKTQYQNIFRKTLDTGCSSCWRDAIMSLTNWLNQQEEPDADINLFTMIYEVPNQRRQAELDQCLKMNQKLREAGILKRIIKIKSFVTYEEIFKLTAKFPNDINIIANSDIFLNSTIVRAHEIRRLEAWCLTRYDYEGKGKARFFNRADSQDVWIFRGHVRNVLSNFTQGRPGCDNRLAYELKKTGYKVLNPSLDIQTIHVHQSNSRTNVNTPANKVTNPYLLIFPHYIGQKAAYLMR